MSDSIGMVGRCIEILAATLCAALVLPAGAGGAAWLLAMDAGRAAMGAFVALLCLAGAAITALVCKYAWDALCGNDGAPVDAEMAERRLTLELMSEDRRHMKLLHLDGVDDATLKVLAGKAMVGALAEGDMTGAAGLFSRSTWHHVRGKLLDSGLLAWRNPGSPAQGLLVTTQGRQVFSQIIDTE